MLAVVCTHNKHNFILTFAKNILNASFCFKIYPTLIKSYKTFTSNTIMPSHSKIIIFSLITMALISTSYGYNPCCSYPCQHQGVCMPVGSSDIEQFECDCTGTGYFGKFCHRATWATWIRSQYSISVEKKAEILLSYPLLWKIINMNAYLHSKVTAFLYRSRSNQIATPHVYNSQHEYITLDVYFNRSFYARELPPVPCDCPTAMGVLGPVELPPVDEIYDRVFKRTTFKPDPSGSNLIFAIFANHFTHQFFKTDLRRGWGFTHGEEGVDASQIYGGNEQTRWALRSKLGGKLKTRIMNGEEFPPFLEDTPGVTMDYPRTRLEYDAAGEQPEVSPKWAFGHTSFSRTPLMFVVATVWIREHNHVCDMLHAIHPRWDDERLYHTARLIVLGEMLTIVVSEYVQHISQYKLRLSYQPHLTHSHTFQYSNRIRLEFDQMYHWHQLIPDEVHVAGTTYNISDILFTNNQEVFEHGFDTWVQAMNRQQAGEITHGNHGHVMEHVCKMALDGGRAVRLQPFNNYRRKFGLKPYETFEELTGEREMAQVLRELYTDIDAVEYTVGSVVEHRSGNVILPTMMASGGPWSMKGVMSNPINSPGWWKPSTFGGKQGLARVKQATLHKLFCGNMKGKCKGFKVGLVVPDKVRRRNAKQALEKQSHFN